ncbi:hypothetical protein [Sphingomonas sinipercae]|nr:hypothetical protein [Sphingomonas sinipercae]
MKLILAIGIVAIIAIVIISMQRSGPRVTTIEHRREDEDTEDRG